MSRYSLLLVNTIGVLNFVGSPFAQSADIKPIHVIEADCYGGLSGLHLSSDGKRLFAGPFTVTRLDLVDGEKMENRTLQLKFVGGQLTNCVHLEKDIWFLCFYCYTAKGYVHRFVLYDFAKKKIEADWVADKSTVECLAFDAKRNRLISAGSRTVCFWDRKTLKESAAFNVTEELGDKNNPNSQFGIDRMVLDPTASYLAFGLNRGMVQVRAMDKKQWKRVAENEEARITSLRFLDNRTLAVGRLEIKVGWLPTALIERGYLDVYDWKEDKKLFRVDYKRWMSKEISGSPDGKLLAVGDDNSRGFFSSGYRICIWDVPAKREIAAFPAYKNSLHGISFSHDGKRLVTSGDEGVVKVWDVESIVNPGKRKR